MKQGKQYCSIHANEKWASLRISAKSKIFAHDKSDSSMAENFSCPSVTGDEALTMVRAIVKAKLIPAFSSIKANSQSVSSGSSSKAHTVTEYSL